MKTQRYIVSYSTGTSRNDEKRYTRTIIASSFTQAATVVERTIAREGRYVTEIKLATPPAVFA